MTNLEKQQKDKYTVVTGEKKYTMRYRPNYYAAKENELFLIEGSNNTLEISLKNGNANDKLDLRTGDKIKISQDLHNEDGKRQQKTEDGEW